MKEKGKRSEERGTTRTSWQTDSEQEDRAARSTRGRGPGGSEFCLFGNGVSRHAVPGSDRGDAFVVEFAERGKKKRGGLCRVCQGTGGEG